jgi:hypothetical protein
MELTREQLVSMAAAVGLNIPAADLENVAAALTCLRWRDERSGAEMDKTEPVPPVYPHEPSERCP